MSEMKHTLTLHNAVNIVFLKYLQLNWVRQGLPFIDKATLLILTADTVAHVWTQIWIN